MTDPHERSLDLRGATIAYDVREPEAASADSAAAAPGAPQADDQSRPGTAPQPGTAPTVVGLHGFTGSRRTEDEGGVFVWDAIADAGRRLVRYDARGHGRSTGDQDPASYRWDALADDLFALLDVVSPDAPVDAFGVSMGVGTLLHAAVRRPERFRRLALVIPPTAWGTRPAQGALYRQMADVVEADGYAGLASAAEAAPTLPILEAGGWTMTAAPDIAEDLFPIVARGAAEADLPPEEALRALAMPVLLRPWTDDPGHPLSTSERLHELLPDSTLEPMRTPDDLRGLGARAAAFLA